MSSIYDRLTDLDISLPPLAIPAGAYVPFVRSGNLVFLSGHIAKRDGKAWVGQLGRDMTTATGKKAARAVAIDLLGTLHAAVGDLDKVERIVRITSLVNSSARLHRAPPRHQRLLGAVRRGLRREGRARAQRLRRRPAAARRLRRDRADRPGRRMTRRPRSRPPPGDGRAAIAGLFAAVALLSFGAVAAALVSQHAFGWSRAPGACCSG